jgi:hypothetical protein
LASKIEAETKSVQEEEENLKQKMQQITSQGKPVSLTPELVEIIFKAQSVKSSSLKLISEQKILNGQPAIDVEEEMKHWLKKILQLFPESVPMKELKDQLEKKRKEKFSKSKTDKAADDFKESQTQ